MANIGSVGIETVPDARAFWIRFQEQTRAGADEAGRSAGRQFGDSFNNEVRRRTNTPVGPSGPASRRQGQQSGLSFSDSFRATVTAALRNLPEARVSGNTTEFDRKLADIRARMTALGDLKIGVDINANAATARLKGLHEELRKLGHDNPDIGVKVDIARATAALAVLQAEIDRVRAERPEVKVRADTKQARGSMVDLIVAIAAVGTAAIPVGGVLAGAFVGVAPAAATALLGVSGIKDEMKSGALAGTSYGASLDVLKGRFTDLKAIAAGGILDGINKAAANSGPLFNELNSVIGTFSGQLGNVVGGVAPALLSILQQLNPLFVTFGDLLGQAAHGLSGFAAGGGLTSFVAYVQQELPTVVADIGALITTISHLVQALAPIGDVVLRGIGLIANILNAIPVNVLTGLGAAALVAFAGFKAFVGIKFILREAEVALLKFRNATNLALAGSLIGGIALLATFAWGMLSSSDKVSVATTANQAYADSVKQTTNALGAANIAATAKVLSDTGALGSLQKLHDNNVALGISFGDLTTAVNGPIGPSKALGEQLFALAQQHRIFTTVVGAGGKSVRTATGSYDASGQSLLDLSSKLGVSRTALQGQIDAQNLTNAATAQSTALYAGGSAASRRMAAALGLTGDAYKKSAAAAGFTGDAYLQAAQAATQAKDAERAQTAQMQAAGDAAGLLTAALARLNGKTLDIYDAQIAAATATATLTKGLQGNRKAWSLNTDAGRANQTNLDQAIRSYQQLAESISGGTKLTRAGTASLRNNLLAERQRLIDMGASQKAIDRVTEAIRRMPKVPRTVPDVNLDTWRKKIAQAQAILNRIRQAKPTGVHADLHDWLRALATAQRNLDDLKHKHPVVIDAVITKLTAAIKVAQTRVNALGQNNVPGIDVNTAAGMLKLQLMQNRLAVLKSRKLDITVNGHLDASARQIFAHTGGGSTTFKTSGGVSFQAGGTGPGGLPEGMGVVGEQGPELVFKRGARTDVVSNPESKQLLAKLGMTIPGFAAGTKANAQAIVDALRKLGVGNRGIAGVLGNARIESDLRSGAYNAGEGARGLFQWEGGRRTALQQLARSMGLSESSTKAQVAMLVRELTGPFRGVLNQLKSAKSASSAASIFDAQYEISSGSSRGARQSAARGFYSQLASGSLKGGGGSSGSAATAAAGSSLTQHGPAGAGIMSVATMLRSQIPGAKAASRDLAKAIGDAFRIQGVQKEIDRLRTKIAGMQQFKSGVTGQLSGLFDPTKSGSVTDLIAGYSGASATNKTFGAQITKLRREGLNKGLLAQLTAAGPNATLDTLAGGSKRDILNVNKSVGAFRDSLNSAGDAAVANQYGTSIASREKALAADRKSRDSLYKKMDGFIGAAGALTHRPIVLTDNGRVLARYVVHSPEFEGVIDALGNKYKYRRK